jgi:hypothetical protein
MSWPPSWSPTSAPTAPGFGAWRSYVVKIPPGHPICPVKRVVRDSGSPRPLGRARAKAIARTRITDIGVEELDRLTSTEVKRVVLREETA